MTGRTLSQQAVDFWLNLLFWSSGQCPRVAKATIPFGIRCAIIFSPELRRRVLEHASQLLKVIDDDRTPRQLALAILANFMEFVIDVGHSSRTSLAEVQDKVHEVYGANNLQNARAAGKGLIIATAHLGSFEVGLAALRSETKNVHVVFQRDRIARFEHLRHRLHEALGIIEAPIDEGWAAWIHLRDALHRDEVVVVQADRVLPGQSGDRVSFLGGHILIPNGPAKLARICDAPILPVFAPRGADGKVRIFIEPPIWPSDVSEHEPSERAVAQTLGDVIAKYVSKYADQWLVLHQVWCD